MSDQDNALEVWPDDELFLDEQPFFPKPKLGHFGIFLNSSPDRWGQMLMKHCRPKTKSGLPVRSMLGISSWAYRTRPAKAHFNPLI